LKIKDIEVSLVKRNSLNRQILYNPSELDQQKSRVVKKKLKNFNPNIIISTYSGKLTEENTSNIFKNYDTVIDTLDNFSSR
jgi:molybdopterin/thiamine biosynthesis adenylyltransferase